MLQLAYNYDFKMKYKLYEKMHPERKFAPIKRTLMVFITLNDLSIKVRFSSVYCIPIE